MMPEQEEQFNEKLATILQEFGEIVAKESQLTEPERSQCVNTIINIIENSSITQVTVAPNTKWLEKKHRFVVVMISSACLLLTFAVYLTHLLPLNEKNHPSQISNQSFAKKNHDLMQIAFEHEAIMGCPLAWFAEWGNDVQFALLPENISGSSSKAIFAELIIEKSPVAKCRKQQVKHVFL